MVEEESVDMDDEDALLEAGGVVEAGREDTIIKLLKLFVLVRGCGVGVIWRPLVILGKESSRVATTRTQ